MHANPARIVAPAGDEPCTEEVAEELAIHLLVEDVSKLGGIHLTGLAQLRGLPWEGPIWGELNPRPAPMTFSYRTRSAHMNSPEPPYEQRWVMRSARGSPLVGAVVTAGHCA